jgi:hypothetical protein
MTEIAPLVRRFSEDHPEFREVGKRMLAAWEAGLLDIRPDISVKARAGDQLRRSVGLSDEKPAPKSKRKANHPDTVDSGAGDES